MNMSFEFWWDNEEIQKIKNKAIGDYRKQISHEDVRQIAALALLKTLKSYNGNHVTKRTVPQFFWVILRNELVSEWNRIKRQIDIDKKGLPCYNNPSWNDSDLFFNVDLSFLDSSEKDLIKDKYLYSKTLREIAETQQCSKEWIRLKIKKVLEKIKDKHLEFKRCIPN